MYRWTITKKEMKRLLFLIMMMAVSWQAAAQRSLIMYGSSEYMYTPPPTEDSVRLYNAPGFNLVRSHFRGTAYRPGHPVTIYGMAFVERVLYLFPYRWV